MSINITKYKAAICELIIQKYNTDEATAFAAINRSGLNESLRISPEITAHIPDEEWAEQIWEGWLKYNGNKNI